MRENILLFVADQMRADSLAHLGNQASITPNLDSILENNEGISFKNAYCQNPVCVPSRISFLSGLYPHTTGHRTMHNLLKSNEHDNILKLMKDNGYYVVWFGRNDVLSEGIDPSLEFCDEIYDLRKAFESKGLDKFDFAKFTQNDAIDKKDFYSMYIGKILNEESFYKIDEVILKKAINFIENFKNTKNDKPIFMYCALSLPHPPYAIEEPYFSNIDRNKLPKRRPDINNLKNKSSMMYKINKNQKLGHWTEEKWNELRATYLGMVSKFDNLFGELINAFKEQKLYDNTNIFVFSDHGDYTGDYSIVEKIQNSFEDPISNIPLIFKPSKSFKLKSRISNALVELVDIPSTISEITSIKIPYTQFGKSILHLLEKEEEHKDAVFCEGGRLDKEEQAKEKVEGFMTENNFYYPRLSNQWIDDGAHGKAVMCRNQKYKYIHRLYENDELYNLDNDPMELENLYFKTEYKDIIFWFKERILKWYVETCDVVPFKLDNRS